MRSFFVWLGCVVLLAGCAAPGGSDASSSDVSSSGKVSVGDRWFDSPVELRNVFEDAGFECGSWSDHSDYSDVFGYKFGDCATPKAIVITFSVVQGDEDKQAVLQNLKDTAMEYETQDEEQRAVVGKNWIVSGYMMPDAEAWADRFGAKFMAFKKE